jgi:hypothetical protein
MTKNQGKTGIRGAVAKTGRFRDEKRRSRLWRAAA